MNDRTGKKIILTCATALMHLVNQDAKKTAVGSQEPTAGNSDGNTVAVLSILQEVHQRAQQTSPSAAPEKKNGRQKLIALKSALYFTKKEISKMPTMFQKLFTIDIPVHVRQKKNGVYEARYRANGFDISVSSVDFEQLKPKFLAELLKQSESRASDTPKPACSVLFRDIAEKWLEIKKPSIKEPSYHFYTGLFRSNILPALGDRVLQEIKQSDVQQLVNRYKTDGKHRTAMKIYQTLNAIFDFALGEELIDRSPMRLLKPPKYEENNGTALTLAEEREFLQKIGESRCTAEVGNALLFLLYTGIRRSELASAQIEDGFVRVVCAKVRKGYRERQRLIPITPMLARHLPKIELDKLRTVRPDALTQAMKRLMPTHHLHELRHTFITRCQECGVAREVVSVWAGHAADSTMTSNVYTHFSPEFMKKEAAKIIYNL